jgi:glycosyltransferase involved in cell wall biosynthesis
LNKKTIILAVTTDLNFDQRVQRIAKTLAENGYEVCVVGRELPTSPPLLPTKYFQFRLKCWFTKGKLFYAEFNLRLFFYLLFKKFDFVTANDLDTVLGVYFSSYFKKTTLVFDAHEYFTEVPELENRNTVKKTWAWIERKFVPKFHKHYTVNNSLAELFEQNLHLNFSVVKNVPYLLTSTENEPIKSKYLLYQGALNKGRGLENMIKAMSKIDLQLKIAGDGDLTQYLKDLVRKEGLEHKVIFLGKIEPKKLPELTKNAFIGINLLENMGLNYYYSLANKFFDYIQAEVPQICVNFPEYQHINQQYKVAVLLENIEVETIVDNINKLLINKELYSELQNNCTKAKQKYCWEKEEEILKEIYT